MSEARISNTDSPDGFKKPNLSMKYIQLRKMNMDHLLNTGVDILQKKPKNALTGKNSAPAKFPKLSNIVILLSGNYDIFIILK